MGFSNTDGTDYTDGGWGRGYFFRTRMARITRMMVGHADSFFSNTDYTDGTDGGWGRGWVFRTRMARMVVGDADGVFEHGWHGLHGWG